MQRFAGDLYDVETGARIGAATETHVRYAKQDPNLRLRVNDKLQPFVAHLNSSYALAHTRLVEVRGVPARLLRPDPVQRKVRATPPPRPVKSREPDDRLPLFIEGHFHARSKPAWTVAAVSVLLGLFGLFLTPSITAANGYYYECPSAIAIATRTEFIDIYPVGGGPDTERLTMARYEALANAPGVWQACRGRAATWGGLGALSVVVSVAAAAVALSKPPPPG